MNRTQKLKMNTIISLLNRIIILVSGLILPRLILFYYGSEMNGLVASIKQFLSIITFLDLGVGSVVQSALYKPLSHHDNYKISVVLTAAKRYFKRIAYVLIVYIFALIIFYPLVASRPINYLGTAFLIIAISISLFAQYYFGIINELLLNADQKGYIQLSAEIVVVILNLFISILLITQGFSIQIVQLFASLIYLIRPVFLTYYVNKHYDLKYDVKVSEDPLPQKWSGMGQHIAYSIQNSTDVIVLTVFSTLENVSIYSVYNMVIQAVRLIIMSFTTGLTSFFGNLLANKENALLNSYFTKIEWGLHTGIIYLFGMTAVLIDSFVMLYTSGITDVNYYAPIFALVFILSKIFNSIRTPYQSLVFAAGHYKQTQKSSVIEAFINIIISLLMVSKFGLIGVAIGTLVSMIYRTIYLVIYLSQNIIYRSTKIFIKHIVVDGVTFILMIFIGKFFINAMQISNFLEWLMISLVVGIIFIILILIINSVFYIEMIIFIYSRLFRKK